MIEPSRGRIAILSGDDMVVRKLEALVGPAGLVVVEPDDAPDVVVVDLDAGDALDVVARWRDRWPEALVVGHLGVPDRARWLEAERAGCDLVANRGGIAAALRKRLATSLRPGRRRIHLFAADDVAGRIGLVHRDPQSPAGPLAVYHLRGRLHAVGDTCPHAGAALSGGDLEGPVVTCPRHGSQFDVRDGTRVRGPADEPIPTFSLLEEGGQIYLLL